MPYQQPHGSFIHFDPTLILDLLHAQAREKWKKTNLRPAPHPWANQPQHTDANFSVPYAVVDRCPFLPKKERAPAMRSSFGSPGMVMAPTSELYSPLDFAGITFDTYLNRFAVYTDAYLSMLDVWQQSPFFSIPENEKLLDNRTFPNGDVFVREMAALPFGARLLEDMDKLGGMPTYLTSFSGHTLFAACAVRS